MERGTHLRNKVQVRDCQQRRHVNKKVDELQRKDGAFRAMGASFIPRDVFRNVFRRPVLRIPFAGFQENAVDESMRTRVHERTGIASNARVIELAVVHHLVCLLHIRIPVKDVGFFRHDSSTTTICLKENPKADDDPPYSHWRPPVPPHSFSCLPMECVFQALFFAMSLSLFCVILRNAFVGDWSGVGGLCVPARSR